MTDIAIPPEAVEAAARTAYAQWYDGPLGPHMDEPGSAETARAALAKLKEGHSLD